MTVEAISHRARIAAAEPAAAHGLVPQIRERLVQAILERRFEVRLPSFDELGLALGVSRTTVRAAVQDLERDGLVSRRRAIGTLVNRHVGPGVLFFQRLMAFDRLLALAGHPSVASGAFGVPLDAASVRELTGVAPEDVLGVTRSHAVRGRVVLVEVDLLRRADAVIDYPGHQVPGSMTDLVAACTSRRIEHSVIGVRPMIAEESRPATIEVEPRRPYLRIVERHFDVAGDPLAWTVVDVDATVLPVETFRGRR